MSVWRASLPSVGLTISREPTDRGVIYFYVDEWSLAARYQKRPRAKTGTTAFLIHSTPALLFGALGHQHAIWLFLRMIAIEFGRSILPLRVCTFAIAALPATSLSWVALSFFSAYVYLTSPKKTPLRRSATIFFAICFPLLWGPELLLLAAPLLLKVDAFLVATLTGAERTGNVIKFIVSGDAETFRGIQIWPGCSSLSNISHAALAWVALTQTLGRDLETKDVFWCGLAMILAGAVNLARLSAMAISPEYYEIFHGPLGEQIAGTLTILLIAFVCIFGQRRELFARA